MATDPNKPAGKTPRAMKVLLAVSLALNLLVVGAVVGLAVSGGGKGGAQRFDLTAGPITRAMDDDRRDRVRQTLRDSGLFGRADRSEIRADMVALLDTIRAEQFDADAFRAALGRQRERLQAAQSLVIDAVAEEIAGMTAEERSAFADRLEDQLRRGPGRPGRSGDTN